MRLPHPLDDGSFVQVGAIRVMLVAGPWLAFDGRREVSEVAAGLTFLRVGGRA
jgi:hypothetical protein